METLNLCPVCSNDTFSQFLICKDYLVSRQEFIIQECQSCGFRFTNPRPDVTEISSYYESEQYVSHNDESGGLINRMYRLVRTITLRSKLNLINELSAGKGKILDVGCGTGTFLETCKLGNWEVMGMEPDANARAIAQERLQLEVKPNLDSLIKTQSFDVITLWHVLEHIHDLNGVIPQLQNLLSAEGTLIIAVPNSNSYDAQYFNQYWAAYDVPRHLYHFTPPTIESLFKKHKFRLIGKRPLLFDAYYIAMLSTQYKTGKTDYIKSVRIGTTSNFKATQTGDSSSLIYLFKKSQ